MLLSLGLCVSCKLEPAAEDEGGSTDSTGTTGSSEGTDGSDEGTDGGGECDGFMDAAADSPNQILVRNDRAEPIYLMTPDDCTFNYVFVSSAMGHWPVGNQELTCAAIIQDNCQTPGACEAPLLLRIEPGGEYPLDWYYLLVADTLPEACAPVSGICQAGPCPRSVAPPDGGYTISTSVLFATQACEGVDDPCACPSGETWCTTEVIVEGILPDLGVETMATLPVDGALVLAIE